MQRHLLEGKYVERSEEIQSKIDEIIRIAAYKYHGALDKQDVYQSLYVEYLEKFGKLPDSWFESPRNLATLATSMKNKAHDIVNYQKRRSMTQVATPYEDYTSSQNSREYTQSHEIMHRPGHEGSEAKDNPRNAEKRNLTRYESTSKAWDPSTRIKPEEVHTRALIRDMAHLINNSYHEYEPEYIYFFGMLGVVDALPYVKDIISKEDYKKFSAVEISGDIAGRLLGMGRVGNTRYIKVANNVRNLLKKHGYSL